MALWTWSIWTAFVVAWTLAITGTGQVSTWFAVAATAAIIATGQVRSRFMGWRRASRTR